MFLSSSLVSAARRPPDDTLAHGRQAMAVTTLWRAATQQRVTAADLPQG
jgi:hypothetical protein